MQLPNQYRDNKNNPLYHFNLLKLADYVANLLTETGVFYPSVTTIKERTCCVQAGFYVPRGTVKCPVYLGIAIDEGELDSLASFLLAHQTSAIMLLPSLDGLSQDVLQAICRQNKAIIALESLQQNNVLINPQKILTALQSVEAEKELINTKTRLNCRPFPTPSGASWRHITVELVNNIKINVTSDYKGEQVFRSYDYAEIGMVDKRTKLPDQQWYFLCGFPEEYGYFTWDNRNADRKHKKTKQRVTAILAQLTGIYDSPPFIKEKDEKGRVCYRTAFKMRAKIDV